VFLIRQLWLSLLLASKVRANPSGLPLSAPLSSSHQEVLNPLALHSKIELSAVNKTLIRFGEKAGINKILYDQLTIELTTLTYLH
jgi:hypothetical protein